MGHRAPAFLSPSIATCVSSRDARRLVGSGACPASPRRRVCAQTAPGGAPARTCVGIGRSPSFSGTAGGHTSVPRSAAHALPRRSARGPTARRSPGASALRWSATAIMLPARRPLGYARPRCQRSGWPGVQRTTPNAVLAAPPTPRRRTRAASTALAAPLGVVPTSRWRSRPGQRRCQRFAPY